MHGGKSGAAETERTAPPNVVRFVYHVRKFPASLANAEKIYFNWIFAVLVLFSCALTHFAAALLFIASVSDSGAKSFAESQRAAKSRVGNIQRAAANQHRKRLENNFLIILRDPRIYGISDGCWRWKSAAKRSELANKFCLAQTCFLFVSRTKRAALMMRAL